MINHAVREDLLHKSYDYRRLHGTHQKLENEIMDLRKHPSANEAQLKELKRQKLRLRESMHQIEARMH